jgi:SAM-dependent methyltransferase
VRAAELEKMFQLEETYWWFVARRRLVRDLLARYGPTSSRAESVPSLRILDVGCGTGATLRTLSEFGEVVGMDSSQEALRFSRRRGSFGLARARAEALPAPSGSVDVITALDLLEHIPDDAAAVRELARALRPGGVLLVTVPALPWLWSEHDEALDHLRRYRARRLREILEGAGLKVERLSPLITLMLLPIAALRMVQRALPGRKARPETAFIIPPAPVNLALTWLLWLESRWALRWSLPVGVSLMAVARKV